MPFFLYPYDDVHGIRFQSMPYDYTMQALDSK